MKAQSFSNGLTIMNLHITVFLPNPLLRLCETFHFFIVNTTYIMLGIFIRYSVIQGVSKFNAVNFRILLLALGHQKHINIRYLRSRWTKEQYPEVGNINLDKNVYAVLVSNY